MSSHFLTPVRRTTLTADICRKLVAHLMRGDWAEGEQIPPERQLCQHLGVGRASLREALKALEIMGMIETRLGEGTFVCQRSDFFARPLLWAITGSDVSDVRELVEARRLIEVELAGLAAERATADDLAKMEEMLASMEAAAGDRERFSDADIGFHMAIAEAGHNKILLNAILLIRNLLREWVNHALTKSGVSATAYEQHKKIFQAIARKRPEQARQSMEAHLIAMSSYIAVEPVKLRPKQGALRSAVARPTAI